MPPSKVIFVGTYLPGTLTGFGTAEYHGVPTSPGGIYRCVFDEENGLLTGPASLVAECSVSPSWFRWHSSLPVMYATNETMDGSPSAVTAYRVDTASGALSTMGTVSTAGMGGW